MAFFFQVFGLVKLLVYRSLALEFALEVGSVLVMFLSDFFVLSLDVIVFQFSVFWSLGVKLSGAL